MKNHGLVVKGLVVAAVMSSMSAKAQDSFEGAVGVDFVSQYVWRGQDCGNISMQPAASLSYKGITLAGWASVGIDATDTKELDFTLSYSIKGLTIGVTDYWFNTSYPNYFSYGSGGATTGHTYEANLGYDFGPVALNWYTNFAGYDGGNKDGDRAYSSYFEVSAPFSFAGLDFKAELGCIPFYTDYYANYNSTGFAVTNIGLAASKEIKITESFSLPIFVKVATNPSAQSAYFVAGFSL